MPQSKWRLSRTLKRQINVRPIENEDVKYAFAAYRKGALGAHFPEGLEPAAFKRAFEEFVLLNAHACWVVIAHSKLMGFAPIGFVLGGWAPQEVFMVIIGIVWFPWASKRNILEGTVAFVRSICSLNWMGFASGEDKRVYDVCMAHGIMRRIGTSKMNRAHSVAVYEGRNVLSN